MKTIKKSLVLLELALTGLLVSFAAHVSGQATNLLYNAPASGARNNYAGAVGCEFKVGSSNVVVSHLGFFSADTNAGLQNPHPVGILTASFSGSAVLGEVTVPAGTNGYWASNYYWVQLSPPLLLSSNTSYFLAALPTSGSDSWPDLFTPTWNTYFVGANGSGTRTGIYAPNNASGESLPPPGGFGAYGGNETYGAGEMANMPVGPAAVGVQQTSVLVSAGQAVMVNGFATGQLPITYQWYLGSLSSPISGQTNAALNIPNSVVTNTGTYFLVASNSLGTAQSSNVSVTVSAVPVGISQQPTNLTVYQNYPASFSVTATGTPPIAYQWFRNGTALSGATSSTYSLTPDFTNNGDVYACLVSNNVSSTPETMTTSNATLTVIYNLGLPTQMLHGYKPNTDTNNYSGMVGGVFETGNSPALVTHLGFYASQFDATGTNATLSLDHHVGIFSMDGTVLYGSVDVPAGLSPVTNGYIWQPLSPPLVLSNNTSYLLAAEVTSGVDPWGDSYTPPDWNPYYVGTNPPATQSVRYSGSGWPTAPLYSFGSAGEIYSAANMAALPMGASAVVQQTNTTIYAGLNATLNAFVDGQPPITAQWYEEPSVQLGDTNLVLNLVNANVGESGSYYVIATNSAISAGAQSPDSILTVLPDVGPSITADIQSVNAFEYQTVQFTVVASGTPPLAYQWTSNSTSIIGATNSSLVLNDVSAASAANYQVSITNNYGSTNSAIAALTVTTPTWGSYPSAVMGTDLMLYYNFSDVGSGLGIATNQGALGLGYDGTYEGIYSGVPGPLVATDSNNMAVSLDGLTADVLIPPLTNVTVSNCTIAAWVNDVNNPQSAGNATIFYQRSASVLGLSVNPNSVGDQLRVTWGGSYHDTGLVLPTNQWAFVAMTVNPTNLAAYLQTGTGMQTVNIAGSYAPATFTANSYIGWDTAGGSSGRRWNGYIGEMMVLNDSLAPTAVNALYLGVPRSATLTIAPSGHNVVITWPGGVLQQAGSVTGPWTPVVGATNGVYTTTPSGTTFYRVQLQ